MNPDSGIELTDTKELYPCSELYNYDQYKDQ